MGHAASSRGIYNEAQFPPDRAQSDPLIHFAPALLLRRRTERSYLRAFEEIIRQITEGAPIPSGVGRFVTVTEDLRGAREGDREPPRRQAALSFIFRWNRMKPSASR